MFCTRHAMPRHAHTHKHIASCLSDIPSTNLSFQMVQTEISVIVTDIVQQLAVAVALLFSQYKSNQFNIECVVFPQFLFLFPFFFAFTSFDVWCWENIYVILSISHCLSFSLFASIFPRKRLAYTQQRTHSIRLPYYDILLRKCQDFGGAIKTNGVNCIKANVRLRHTYIYKSLTQYLQMT